MFGIVIFYSYLCIRVQQGADLLTITIIDYGYTEILLRDGHCFFKSVRCTLFRISSGNVGEDSIQ